MDYSLQLTIIAILVSLLVFVWHSTIQGKKRNKGDTDSNKKSKEAPVPAVHGIWQKNVSRPMTSHSRFTPHNGCRKAHGLQLRRTLELLSNRRLEMLKHVRVSELNMGMRDLYNSRVQSCACGTEPVVGGFDSQHVLSSYWDFCGFGRGSFLRWFDVQGHERAMKKTAKDLDYILEGWLKEYRDQGVDGGVKAEAVDLATGNYQGNLAAIPRAGPLLGPREAQEDCNVAGYHVPAGTRLVVNLWKLHRDPRVWEEPSAFRPERFLTSDAVDVRGQNFELIPFGSGRRSCPGMSFALQVLHLTLARLLHAFEFATPSDQPVDMTESPGLTMPKATLLEVLLTSRLPAKLYAY
uniref:Uncharacterized protein n=1 Tax=Glycine max TaxID=3847 RepID=A0A0R0JBJ4_SOYBN